MKYTNQHPTFCALPWVHRFTNIGGEIQVCCTSEEFDNAVRDDAGSPMKFTDQTNDEEVMNSTFMKKLRLEMLDGKLPAMCERCKVTEASGGISRRNFSNEEYKDQVQKMIAETEKDGTIPVRVQSSDFRLGNLCNLACRMCSPRSTQQWLKDWNNVDENEWKMSETSQVEYENYNWYNSPAVLDQVKKQAPHLKHMHFAGGEPLVTPRMFEILRTCVEMGESRHIELTYNTNITKIPKEAKDLWPKFKGVRLFTSIDGVGPLNELIRHPSHWDTIDRNFKDLEANHKQYGIIQVLICCTVQVYNVLELDKLYDYLSQFKFIGQLPLLVDLYVPHYYRTQVLPPELKKLAAQRLRTVEAKAIERIRLGQISKHQEHLLESLRGVIGFMDAEDRTKDIPRFLKVSKSKDYLRKQSVFKLVPELRELENQI